MESSREKAAQAWCKPSTHSIEMIPELAEAFAEIIEEIWSHPWMGNATTRELLAEISARFETGVCYHDTNKSPLDYRTVDDFQNQGGHKG